MKKHNIFKISHRKKFEDKFTYSLAYILNKYPKVGQSYLNRVCSLSGLKNTKFIEATDHPLPSITCKPDFLIKGKEFEVLFEHKIDAELGSDQLDRYLKIANENKQKLCFVTNYLTKVSSSILRSKTYLKNNKRDHFVWSDFFDIFGSSEFELVQEFAEWMHTLGMDPGVWIGHADPFVDEVAINEFKSCAENLKHLIDQRYGKLSGRTVKRGPVSPCFEIRKALPHVHLIYVSLVKAEESWEWGIQGPHLQFSIIMREQYKLHQQDGVKKTKLGDLKYFYIDDSIMNWDKTLYEARGYYIETSKVLNKNLEVTRQNLEHLTICVLDHLKSELNC